MGNGWEGTSSQENNNHVGRGGGGWEDGGNNGVEKPAVSWQWNGGNWDFTTQDQYHTENNNNNHINERGRGRGRRGGRGRSGFRGGRNYSAVNGAVVPERGGFRGGRHMNAQMQVGNDNGDDNAGNGGGFRGGRGRGREILGFGAERPGFGRGCMVSLHFPADNPLLWTILEQARKQIFQSTEKEAEGFALQRPGKEQEGTGPRASAESQKKIESQANKVALEFRNLQELLAQWGIAPHTDGRAPPDLLAGPYAAPQRGSSHNPPEPNGWLPRKRPRPPSNVRNEQAPTGQPSNIRNMWASTWQNDKFPRLELAISPRRNISTEEQDNDNTTAGRSECHLC